MNVALINLLVSKNYRDISIPGYQRKSDPCLDLEPQEEKGRKLLFFYGNSLSPSRKVSAVLLSQIQCTHYMLNKKRKV